MQFLNYHIICVVETKLIKSLIRIDCTTYNQILFILSLCYIFDKSLHSVYWEGDFLFHLSIEQKSAT